ncbi:MAG: hypothetical protein P4L79_10685 [Legionella sp.]|uniref:hypothetical protein n=1 Tax=Legionella sp. TaxID=459 RepID=UPI00284AD5D4|nr:hypothetical protein [Legionella sp.]
MLKKDVEYAHKWCYTNGIEIEEPPDGIVGFIYIITNIASGKRYIGKKNFYTVKTHIVKKKKKREKIESDWKEYWSSSDQVKLDVELLGKDNFTREIIHFCSSKAEMTYSETKAIFVNDALIRPNDFYNAWCMCRVRSLHLKHLWKE